MKKQTHDGLHKYERVKAGTSGNIIYKCQRPGCPHYLPYEELALNRLSQCWTDGCPNEVLLTKDMVNWHKVPKPYCKSCIEERRARRESLQAVPMINEDDEIQEGMDYEE